MWRTERNTQYQQWQKKRIYLCDIKWILNTKKTILLVENYKCLQPTFLNVSYVSVTNLKFRCAVSGTKITPLSGLDLDWIRIWQMLGSMCNISMCKWEFRVLLQLAGRPVLSGSGLQGTLQVPWRGLKYQKLTFLIWHLNGKLYIQPMSMWWVFKAAQSVHVRFINISLVLEQ